MQEATESTLKELEIVSLTTVGLVTILCSILLGFVALVKWIWPLSIPFGLFDVWAVKGSLVEAVNLCWPFFAWGIGATLLFSWLAIRRGKFDEGRYAIGFKQCVAISLLAGVFEEIIFRWLLFYLVFATIPFGNWLVFGWAGFGVTEWSFTILGPIANFFTLGKLAPYLLGSMGWVIGMAVLGANANFRNGHKYLGPLGYVNSWFLGMLFFFLMFQYGIVAAILVHFLYDLVVLTSASIVAKATPQPRYRMSYGYRY